MCSLEPGELGFRVEFGFATVFCDLYKFVDSVVPLVPAPGAVMLVKCIEVAADTFGGDGGHDAAGQ